MRYLMCMVTNDDNLCRLVLNVVKVLLGQHGVVCVGRSEVDLEAWAAHQDSRSSLGSPRSSSLLHHEIRESAEAHESPVLRTHLDNLFFAKPRALSGAVACGRWKQLYANGTHGKRWWTKVNNRYDGVIHMMVCIFKMYHTSGHVFRLQTASTWGISSSVVRAHLASNESIRYLVHDKADFASVASLSSHGPARRARQGKHGETRLAKLSLSLLFSALPQVRDYILDHKLNELPNWQWALDLCPEIKFKAFDFWNQQECCLCAHLFSWWRLVKFWQNVTMENDIVFHHPVVKVTAKDVFQLPEPCWAMLDGQMTAEKCSAQDAARPDWWDQIAIVGDPISEVAGTAQRLSGDSQVRNLRHGTQDAACTVVVHSCTLYITVHHCTSLYITVHHSKLMSIWCL